MNIAIFGSAFNPPTLGHADVINQLLELTLPFDQISLVPSFKHAFNKKMMPYDMRLTMLDLFVSDMRNKKLSVLPIEHEIYRQDTPVYTFDLLSHIQKELYPSDNLSFVIGPDNQQNWHKFYKSEEIAQRWDVIHVDERINIRSTTVRQLLNQNKSVNKFVTQSVAEYLEQNVDKASTL